MFIPASLQLHKTFVREIGCFVADAGALLKCVMIVPSIRRDEKADQK